MTEELVRSSDVLAAVAAVADALDAPATNEDLWEAPAGDLDWTCRHTLAHTADCLVWYAANLARSSTHLVEVAELTRTAPAPILVDALRSAGALLAAAVAAATPEQRGLHPFGKADRSGFAAMGCDEVLVHGADIAAGVGVEVALPADVCDHVVRRLFPWAPTDADPWATLLWANGRASLDDLEPERKWLWHCAPLDEWDGKRRRMPK